MWCVPTEGSPYILPGSFTGSKGLVRNCQHCGRASGGGGEEEEEEEEGVILMSQPFSSYTQEVPTDSPLL